MSLEGQKHKGRFWYVLIIGALEEGKKDFHP